MTYSTSPRNTRWRHTGVSFVEDLDIKKDIDDVNLQMNEIMELIRDRYQIYEPPISFDEPEESNNDTECSVPFDSPPFPCTNVLGEVKVDIDLPFGEVDTLSMGDKEIDLNYHRDVENLGSFLADDPVPNPKMFDDPFRIPSDESKVLIEVLSMLWGNRLPFPDGSFPLTRKLKDHRT
ncbi:hypothetical protein Tco_0164515 [Tanacetum coccineum]